LSVTSWQSVDGDFDYEQFWQTIVDFFEKAPGQVAQCRVDVLLEWWTRCIMYIPHCKPRLKFLFRKVFDETTAITSLTQQKPTCLLTLLQGRGNNTMTLLLIHPRAW
jgi:hypothetical protein